MKPVFTCSNQVIASAKRLWQTRIDPDIGICAIHVARPQIAQSRSRSSGLRTPPAPLLSTCVYTIVVATSRCPRSSWMVRISWPFSRRCVANADLGAMEVDVLDPQVAAFEEAEAAAVEDDAISQHGPLRCRSIAATSGGVSTTGRRIGRLARTICCSGPSERPSTSTHRKTSALSECRERIAARTWSSSRGCPDEGEQSEEVVTLARKARILPGSIGGRFAPQPTDRRPAPWRRGDAVARPCSRRGRSRRHTRPGRAASARVGPRR